MPQQRNITYFWGDQSLLITLGNRTSGRIRALYLAEFVFTMGMATIFLLQALPLNHNFAHWAACTGASLIYLLAANRFLARMFFNERLLLDQQSFTIIS